MSAGFYVFLFTALGCALNGAIYAATGSVVNLGCAILCGFLAAFNLSLIRRP
jgi:hypothetical protein